LIDENEKDLYRLAEGIKGEIRLTSEDLTQTIAPCLIPSALAFKALGYSSRQNFFSSNLYRESKLGKTNEPTNVFLTVLQGRG
jgi:hypothetical protein